eukprot:332172-Chlamydomonas_euryale.AAC.2
MIPSILLCPFPLPIATHLCGRLGQLEHLERSRVDYPIWCQAHARHLALVAVGVAATTRAAHHRGAHHAVGLVAAGAGPGGAARKVGGGEHWRCEAQRVEGALTVGAAQRGALLAAAPTQPARRVLVAKDGTRHVLHTLQLGFALWGRGQVEGGGSGGVWSSTETGVVVSEWKRFHPHVPALHMRTPPQLHAHAYPSTTSAGSAWEAA